MTANSVIVTGNRRRSRAAGERLVTEFQQSGLGRKAFCATHGLSVHTLDAWRRRVAVTVSHENILPVEIVENRTARKDARQVASVERNGQFRIVLAAGLCIEVEPGFDAVALRRLIVALDHEELRGGFPLAV